jgi:hypothetical protein
VCQLKTKLEEINSCREKSENNHKKQLNDKVFKILDRITAMSSFLFILVKDLDYFSQF